MVSKLPRNSTLALTLFANSQYTTLNLSSSTIPLITSNRPTTVLFHHFAVAISLSSPTVVPMTSQEVSIYSHRNAPIAMLTAIFVLLIQIQVISDGLVAAVILLVLDSRTILSKISTGLSLAQRLQLFLQIL